MLLQIIEKQLLFSVLPKIHDGGAPTARFRGRVPVIPYQRRPLQNRPYHLSLHPDSAAVNDSQNPVTHSVSFT